MIKKFWICVLMFCVAFFVFYLVGAFIAVSFDISAWSIDLRTWIGFLGLIAGVVTALDTIEELKLS